MASSPHRLHPVIDRGRVIGQNNNGNITVEGSTAQPASIATDGVYIVRGIMYTGEGVVHGYDV